MKQEEKSNCDHRVIP